MATCLTFSSSIWWFQNSLILLNTLNYVEKISTFRLLSYLSLHPLPWMVCIHQCTEVDESFWLQETWSSSNSKGAIFLFIPIVVFWIPTHYFFRWLRRKNNGFNANIYCVLGCAILTIVMLYLAMKLGNNKPELARLGSESELNMMWLPAGLSVLGVWAGFLSGYLDQRIIWNFFIVDGLEYVH